MTEPLPRRRTAALPTFRPPSSPPDPSTTQAPDLDLVLDPTATGLPPAADPGGGHDVGLARDLPIPKPVRSDTPTPASDTSDIDPKLVVGLAVALLGIAVSAIAVLVTRARPARKLRKPSTGQVKAFAEPVTDILLRHIEITRLHPSLVDGVKAAGALGGYLEEGPLTLPADPPPAGVPHDLQEAQQ